MAERIRVGDRLPFLLYDTPYSAGNRFRDLLDAQAPLVLVFMANFGHPITRTFASRYADTYTSLHDGGFALVVRSRADKLARSIGPDTLPYPLLCDAAGVLYEHLSIPTPAKARSMSYSLEGWRILREAEKAGLPARQGGRAAAAADADPGPGRHGAVLPLRRKPDGRTRGLRGHPEPAGGDGADARTGTGRR